MLEKTRERPLLLEKDLNQRILLTVKQACDLAGIPYGTWQHLRERKFAADPTLKDFPEDRTLDGNPNSRVYHDREEVVKYAKSRPVTRKRQIKQK
jgi:hypothetical protein